MMRFFLILLLATNFNIFSVDNASDFIPDSRNFFNLCRYLEAKQGQAFNEQDYAEFDQYLSTKETFSLYSNASILWGLTDSQAIDKSIIAFRRVIDGSNSDYTYAAAAKIVQIHPEEMDALAELMAEKLREYPQEKFSIYFSYPGMTGGEPAEYTEEFKNKRLIDSFKEKILNILLRSDT